MFGLEHPSRGLGIGVCPTSIFGVHGQVKNSMSNDTSISNVTETSTTDLAKKYEETKIDLSQTQAQLGETKTKLWQTQAQLGEIKIELSQTKVQMGTLYKFLPEKFGSDLPNFNQDISHP